MSAALDFGRAWATRFFEVQGVDRAMALAAQMFSAILPLLVVFTAVVPRPDGESFADALVDRFELSGTAAASVREAFAVPTTVEDGVSALGLALLVVSALSFTRGLQRLYEAAYRLPARGMRGTWSGLAWLGAVGVFLTIRPVVAGLFDGPVLRLAVSLALAAALWTATPYILLGARMAWRPLLPGALLASAGNTALTASSVVWFPPTVTSSSEQYGVMGVAFALLSWLVAASFVVVVSTVGGAATLERLRRASP
jgi:membrane protein